MSNAEGNTSGPFHRGRIADLPLMRTLLTIRQNYLQSSFCKEKNFRFISKNSSSGSTKFKYTLPWNVSRMITKAFLIRTRIIKFTKCHHEKVMSKKVQMKHTIPQIFLNYRKQRNILFKLMLNITLTIKVTDTFNSYFESVVE